MTRHRLVVNLVPLLDVVMIMVFAIYIQSQFITRQGLRQKHAELDKLLDQERQRTQSAERALAERNEQMNRLHDDLKEQARSAASRRTENQALEDKVRSLAAELALAKKDATDEDRKRAEQRALSKVRQEMDLANSLQQTFDLDEKQLQQALSAMPEAEDARRQMLGELQKMREAGPERLPAAMRESPEFRKRNDAVNVYIERDGRVVVRRLDGTLLGEIRDYTSPESVQTKFGQLLEQIVEARNFTYVIVRWDNVLLDNWRTVIRGLTGELEYLRLRPQNEGRFFFLVLGGFGPPEDPPAP